MIKDNIIWIRGAGELGSATAVTLKNSGFSVFLSELPVPLAIRRTVTFSDAMLTGSAEVEGVKALLCENTSVQDVISKKYIPIIEDGEDITQSDQPTVMVDARMLKSADIQLLRLAPFTIGLGPGFSAVKNCHAVIETKRGHNLGKIIWQGSASPNTGIPGNIGGETTQRVVRADAEGRVEWGVDFGAVVAANQIIGLIAGTHEIHSPIAGLVRGLIAPQVLLQKGLKIADIDPRGAGIDYFSISDKSRAVARAVLEAILIYLANINSISE